MKRGKGAVRGLLYQNRAPFKQQESIMTKQELNNIKDALLQYLLADVSDNFDHLTVTEQQIIGDQETFNALLEHIDNQGGE